MRVPAVCLLATLALVLFCLPVVVRTDASDVPQVCGMRSHRRRRVPCVYTTSSPDPDPNPSPNPNPSHAAVGGGMQNVTHPVLFVLYHKTGHNLANIIIHHLWENNLVRLSHKACITLTIQD
jgi:hypothetical protein